MKLLETSFRRDGFLYTQLKRNDKVVLYSVGGTYSDKTSYYEVCKIQLRQADKRYGKELRESLPSNEMFGRDLSRCFNNYKSALHYFDELTTRLNLLQGVPKSVSGVEENSPVISGHQLLAA